MTIEKEPRENSNFPLGVGRATSLRHSCPGYNAFPSSLGAIIHIDYSYPSNHLYVSWGLKRELSMFSAPLPYSYCKIAVHPIGTIFPFLPLLAFFCLRSKKSVSIDPMAGRKKARSGYYSERFGPHAHITHSVKARSHT